jgi:hypothetical protein
MIEPGLREPEGQTRFGGGGGNRTNLFIGVLHLVTTIGVNRAPDLDDVFFAVIEIAALLLILRLAWNWKEHAA